MWVSVCEVLVCMFFPWPLHDPVACLSSLYFNLSSVPSLSSCMLDLILHCHLSLWIQLRIANFPHLLPSFQSSPQHASSQFFLSLLPVLTFLLSSSSHICLCAVQLHSSHCFPLLLIISLGVSLLPFASFPSLFIYFFLSLTFGCLQQWKTGGLVLSNGGTLRSEGLLASQRYPANTTLKQ